MILYNIFLGIAREIYLLNVTIFILKKYVNYSIIIKVTQVSKVQGGFYMTKRNKQRNVPKTSMRQWRTVIFDEETGEIIVLTKKGDELLKEEGVEITLDFEKRKMSIRNKNNEVRVFDLERVELQIAYKYEGCELKQIE